MWRECGEECGRLVRTLTSILAWTGAIAEQITIDSEQCYARPCVRGMRIRVSDVLDLFAAGLSPAEILEEIPDLEDEDLRACLRFASRYLDGRDFS